MASNTFGNLFSITTFGESHGLMMGCVVDGCPAGLELTANDIQSELDRRKPGTSKFVTGRREADVVTIASGIFEDKTTGAPIALLIANNDQHSRDYEKIKEQFRPGHGDYTYWHKYGIRDHRGGGRASARETVNWVAAGAIAKKYLKEKLGVRIWAYVEQVGDIVATDNDFSTIGSNPFFFPDPTKITAIEDLITSLRRDGDSIGAKICVKAENVPLGLGEPIFQKLDGEIAKALMNINAVKGVEIGVGFGVVTKRGSEYRDELTATQFLSNNAGGILAGISTGQEIVARLALKPTSSIRIPAKTINTANEEVTIVTKGRHDVCVGFRAVPIAEAVLALVLMDFYLLFKART